MESTVECISVLFCVATLKKDIGFIGGGNIARAIGHGIINNGLVEASKLHVSEPVKLLQENWREMGVNISANNAEVVQKTDTIFLLVKPGSLKEAMESLKQNLGSLNIGEKLFVSVLAGVSLAKLEEIILPIIPKAKIIRTMPNMALMVGAGATVFACGHGATKQDADLVTTIMSSIGICEQVPEDLINPITGLSGAGPAYVYVMIEALADGAVRMGVPRDLAIKFAGQSFYGASKMLLQTKKHPGQLKDEVCSPGGITICGVHAIENGGVRAALMNAVVAAVQRSSELDKK
ncbi:pyrroline-5-carboxylate reductase isoform X1 [Neodiprion lecontei]|uniref:pyrroline-5-carboxylate reductase n=1 Tax=Neodiprion lecontei TaxID=441921 RepID=A0ABM3GIY3_NEOLC|nr:pyrroline-5-carboxylate reductase isoform X1 [Neodiprion pinetum]XP_046600218.1 pyrroline-5-carboxylate reductase isoform X1 [Neodiprion lecontei]